VPPETYELAFDDFQSQWSHKAVSCESQSSRLDPEQKSAKARKVLLVSCSNESHGGVQRGGV
jgi:hypothetical protein